MRFNQATYGQQIDGWEREIERLAEAVKRAPQRSHEIKQCVEIVAKLKTQMRQLGKRRSSGFYGFEGERA